MMPLRSHRADEYTYRNMMSCLPADALEVHLLVLAVSTDLAMRRTASRGRSSEASIPREYMQLLVERHETLAEEMDPHGSHMVDASRSEDEVFAEVHEIVSELLLSSSVPCATPAPSASPLDGLQRITSPQRSHQAEARRSQLRSLRDNNYLSIRPQESC